MCLSVNASFTAATGLIIIGVVSVINTPHRSQWLFAAIPLLFGVQQIAEGVLWLALPKQDYVNTQKALT